MRTRCFRPMLGVIIPRFDQLVPYIATHLERAVFHVTVLPEDWSLVHQLGVAQMLAMRNRLETYLVPQAAGCLSFDENGNAHPMYVMPSGAPIVMAGLRTPDPIEATGEIEARMEALRKLSRKTAKLAKGDPALDGVVIEELAPSSMEACASCGEWNRDCVLVQVGEELQEVPLRCACRNDTLCARCDYPLWEARLRAVSFDHVTGTFRYGSGRYALSHRCPDEG